MATQDAARDLSISLLSSAHSLVCAAMKAQEFREDVHRQYEGQLPADWHRMHGLLGDLYDLLKDLRGTPDTAEAATEAEA